MPADERLTLAEAAKLTGLTQRALARRMERGTLPGQKNDDGLRTVSRRELAAAGLLDLATGKPPAWMRGRPGETVARELLRDLAQRGLRIYELERGHAMQAEELAGLRRELPEARRGYAELRRELERLQRRSPWRASVRGP